MRFDRGLGGFAAVQTLSRASYISITIPPTFGTRLACSSQEALISSVHHACWAGLPLLVSPDPAIPLHNLTCSRWPNRCARNSCLLSLTWSRIP